MLPRTPEPELMDTPAQVEAYASADFAVSHQELVDRLLTTFPGLPATGAAIDLGCGPGDVTRRLAHALPGWTIDGIDAGPGMLARAVRDTPPGPFGDRVRYHEVRLPATALPRARYDLVVSNSLLHHLDEPMALWQAVRLAAAAGTPVMVKDLRRPGSAAEVDRMVREAAGADPPVLQQDFRHSLHAAYTVDEVRAQLAAAGLDFDVTEVGERHLVVAGRT